MRIALAAHTAGRAGGVESYLTTIMPALRRRGHDVACVFESAADHRDSVLAPDRAIQVWTAGAQPAAALDALSRWKPDVLFAHGMRSPALEAQLFASAPSVFFAHSYYGTCVSGAKSFRFPSDRVCGRVFGPACLLHYYPRRCGGLSPQTMVRQFRLQRDRRQTLERSGRIVVASRHMAAEYARHGFEDKVRMIPLPVAAPRVRHQAHDGGPVTLLYLGRLERTKGADLALRAAALAAASIDRPVRLQISGHGTLSARLRVEAARAARAGTNLTVDVTGWLSAEDCQDALAGADLLLLPSRWPEPFGLVGLEAAGCGVPAIAFDSGGIRDWLVDGVNGRLVPANPPDVHAFADAIVDCLSDMPRFARLQQQARAVAARHGLEAHVAALERVFAEIAANVPAAVLR